jgi:hypothetical protein
LPNSGINPGNPFNFLLEDFFDPCKCYKIRIRTKNYCNENVAELILNWDRESSPTNINLANIVICDENGKRLLCLSAKGVKQVNFDIYDRWGGSKLNTTLDYNNDPFCFEIPNSWTSGTYFYIIKLIGCDGSIITYHGSILVPDCEGQLNLGTEDFYLDSVLTSNNDSLHFEIIDNPVSTQSKVKYYLSNSGTVSIKLLDKNFELKAVLLNNTLQASGNHELPINTSNLPNGLYYCSIEFQGSKSIKAYKIILKN